MSQCRHCGAANAADARFCNQCGQPIGAPRPEQDPQAYTPQHLVDQVLRHRSAMEGERKQVTVLFADMAGSTRIANQLDPEEWHRILDQYFSLLSEDIHRYEGTINQFTGDGVMALFGAPLALEDHAQRAARAALSLRDRLREFADRLRLEQGINPSTRMGLNSGEVVVGRIGDDLRMDYTAKGMTVNLAARMEQIAEPGSVYLTQYTAELLRDYFRLRPLGPLQVKGQETPVRVFELAGKTDVSLRLDASRARGLTGFAGRERELQILLQAREQRGAGRRVLVVSGDGGLGKSRLCFEAMQRWRAQGLQVFACSGLPHGQAAPLQPVRELILQRFGVQPADEPAQARQKIAGALLMHDENLRGRLTLLFEFLQIAAPDAPVSDLPPEVRERQVRDMFREVCLLDSGQPRVLLIEDLHWLDAGSQEFFRIMLECEQCGDSLVIFNTRPGPLPAWLAGFQPQLIQLEPLSTDAMTQMTRGLLGSGEGLDLLAERIAEQAAGNPFYIEETVRSLASSGHLLGEPGAYRLQSPVQQVRIPASVQALIAGRVDRLEPADKELLQVAAVLGQRCDGALLRHVSALDDNELEQALRRLELGNYLRGDDQAAIEQWVFCHPLLQEVVYASLLRDRRVVLHRQVAELLEPYFDKTGSQRAAAGLAHHWEAAGERVKAAEWGLRVGLMLGQHDVQQEIRYLRHALELLEPLPESSQGQRLAVQVRSSLLRVATFYHVADLDVDAVYSEARALAEGLGETAVVAELLISNGVRLLNRSHADQAVANTGEAMRLAQALEDDSLEARFRIPILLSYFAAGWLEEGLQVLDRRDGGAWHRGAIHADNMLSRGFRAMMLAFSGKLETAEDEARRALACVEQEQVRVSWMYANLVDLLILRGKLDDAPMLAEKARQLAREFGSPIFLELAERASAQVLLARGKADAACEVLESARDLVAPGSLAAQFATAHLGLLAAAWLRRGDARKAREIAEQATAVGETAGQRIWTLRAMLVAARAQLMLETDARPVLSGIAGLIKTTSARLFQGDWLELSALQARLDGDTQGAGELLAQARQHWLRCGAPGRVHELETAA